MFMLGFYANAVKAESPRYAYSDQKAEYNGDRVSSDQIKVYKDRVEIEIEGAKYAPIKDTNSMQPVLNGGSHSIEVDVSDVTLLEEGDIISFYQPNIDKMIIHSIIEIGYDEIGWYAITKGLNNDKEDPWKVREFMVEGVLVGVIY